MSGGPKETGTTFNSTKQKRQKGSKRKAKAAFVKCKKICVTGQKEGKHASGQSAVITQKQRVKLPAEEPKGGQTLPDAPQYAEQPTKGRKTRKVGKPSFEETIWPSYLPKYGSEDSLSAGSTRKAHGRVKLSICGNSLPVNDLLLLVAPNWLCDQVCI